MCKSTEFSAPTTVKIQLYNNTILDQKILERVNDSVKDCEQNQDHAIYRSSSFENSFNSNWIAGSGWCGGWGGGWRNFSTD